MIKASRVQSEGRKRDGKRGRVYLAVGARGWHITRAEARALGRQLARALMK